MTTRLRELLAEIEGHERAGVPVLQRPWEHDAERATIWRSDGDSVCTTVDVSLAGELIVAAVNALPELLEAVERVERVEAVVTQLEQTFAQYDAGTPKGVAILGMADAILRGIREALAGTDGGEAQP